MPLQFNNLILDVHDRHDPGMAAGLLQFIIRAWMSRLKAHLDDLRH